MSLSGARRGHAGPTPGPHPLPPRAIASPKAAGEPGEAAAPEPSPQTEPMPFTMPFPPYPVQQAMMCTITDALLSRGPGVTPVVATEVPTGCGKTLALLSSVLQYQAAVRRMTPRQAEEHFSQRSYPPPADPPAPARRRSATRRTPAGGEAEWAVPPDFFRQFRVDRAKRLRVEVDPTGSSELRRRFVPPPCTIFYATRTHAQLHQVVRELRRLLAAPAAATVGAEGDRSTPPAPLRMNILGSRERYCIHPTLRRATASTALPVEGNNLGEVCDKLVSLGQCDCVHGYDELACSAIDGCSAIGSQMGKTASGTVWDLEDLVLEGVARQACPYYASRDLVFYADITFCPYNYLLDPLIRLECNMEAAIHNRAIVVLDEAHNVPPTCQEALSLRMPLHVLATIVEELAPLIEDAAGAPSSTTRPASFMAYPRDFHLAHFSLTEIFSFLLTLFRALDAFYRALPALSADGEGLAVGPAAAPPEEAHTSATLASALARQLTLFVTQRDLHTRAAAPPATPWLPLFKCGYALVMALGVTFNPFSLSIFALSAMKRWLLVLRFLLPQPTSFAVAHTQRPGEEPSAADPPSLITPLLSPAPCPGEAAAEVRCLDGSLAFHHLARAAHRVVLASGSLSPFYQLARDLGLALVSSPPTPREASLARTCLPFRAYDGPHVVGPEQYVLRALTTRGCARGAGPPPPPPLHCNFDNLGRDAFLDDLARVVYRLATTVPAGGVLVFAPNYRVMEQLWRRTQALLASNTRWERRHHFETLAEPRRALELPAVLDRFRGLVCPDRRARAPTTTALLFAVYRGKISEGIDFTDSMARLVLCVGVPLQPLRSWTVCAQRRFSGPAWYTTEAVRAVNQALGRCLRHAHDYGAVVLLDSRYGGADLQQRLPRWCRSALRTESSLAALVDELVDFFADRGLVREGWAEDGAGECAERPGADHGGDGDGLARRDRTPPGATLGSELLPFRWIAQPTGRAHAPQTDTAATVRPPRHPWGPTALKLLSEEAELGAVVTLADLRDRLAALEAMFPAAP